MPLYKCCVSVYCTKKTKKTVVLNPLVPYGLSFFLPFNKDLSSENTVIFLRITKLLRRIFLQRGEVSWKRIRFVLIKSDNGVTTPESLVAQCQHHSVNLNILFVRLKTNRRVYFQSARIPLKIRLLIQCLNYPSSLGSYKQND